jgi:hypothetical protein
MLSVLDELNCSGRYACAATVHITFSTRDAEYLVHVCCCKPEYLGIGENY